MLDAFEKPGIRKKRYAKSSKAKTKTSRSYNRTPSGGVTKSKTPVATGQKRKNLNAIKQVREGGIVCNNVVVKVDIEAQTVSNNVTQVTAITFNIESAIVGIFDNYGKGEKMTVLACMAWFYNKPILNAFIRSAKRSLVVVNDEDYSLRQDVLPLYDALPPFDEPLHRAFSHIEKSALNSLDRDQKGRKLSQCSFKSAVYASGTGILNGESSGPSSLMHNKYFIFFKSRQMKTGPGYEGRRMVDIPCAVLTGSFNATQNANRSLENVVFIEDEKIAMHFFKNDFSMIFMHSRPLRR